MADKVNRQNASEPEAEMFIDVGQRGASVVLFVVVGAEKTALPISPRDARMIGSLLFQHARQIDPKGHHALIETMAREIGERVLFESMISTGPTH